MSKFDDFKIIEKELKGREPKSPLDIFRNKIDDLLRSTNSNTEGHDSLIDIKSEELDETDMEFYSRYQGGSISVEELINRENSSTANESQKRLALYIRTRLVEQIRAR